MAKGRYRLTLDDLERNLDHCVVRWVPQQPLAPSLACGAREDILQQARYLARRFPQRAWIAVELLRGPHDGVQLDALRELSAHSGLPLVAAGNVHMHVRSRKALQDTLTAIRLNTTIAEAGHYLQPNAEQHLRTRLRLAHIYPPAGSYHPVSYA